MTGRSFLHALSLDDGGRTLIPTTGAKLRDGRLADIAPTLLALMGLAQPKEMTGRSLLG